MQTTWHNKSVIGSTEVFSFSPEHSKSKNDIWHSCCLHYKKLMADNQKYMKTDSLYKSGLILHPRPFFFLNYMDRILKGLSVASDECCREIYLRESEL